MYFGEVSRYYTFLRHPRIIQPKKYILDVRGKFHSYQIDLIGAQSSYEMFASSSFFIYYA